MRHLVRKSFLIVFLILVAIISIVPPSKKLKGGRDLTGGVNFVYQVDVTGDVETKQAVMDRVKEVVKERLDPKGILDISVVQQGADRLEISMPLPSTEVRARFQKFESELATIGQSSIDPVLFDRLMALEADQREAEFRKLIGEDAPRWVAIRAAEAAFAKKQAAAAPYEQAELELADADAKLRAADPSIGPEFLTLLQQARAAADLKASQLADPLLDAEKEYDTAKQAALSAGVSIPEVQRVLRLRTDEIVIRDPKNPNTIIDTIPSRRAEAIKELKARHPGSDAAVDRVITAWDEYERNRTTLNDPSDLVRLLKGSGVLNFRITVNPGELPAEQELRRQLRSFGPQGTRADQARWYKINKIENWYNRKDVRADIAILRADAATFFADRGFVGAELDGEYYLLCWDTKDKRLTERDGKRWVLTGASQTRDELGRPAISFQMDGIGGDLLGELTGSNLGKKMAVVLDDEIYTAPRLNGRITTSGIIEGDFSTAEINYIIKVLSNGSMEGKLSKEPISQQVVAAEAGADNLRKGLTAGVISFILCAGFMIVYYFGCGLLSILAMVLNLLLVVATMSIQNSPFTLPGIAGLILVFGMAVDANVLIYERMREEIKAGQDLKTAVRLGYQKAFASILDGNITTLIACVVLGFFGTQEIKGFAITLGLGNVMTLFTQLFVTRVAFGWLVERLGVWRRASMLPLAVRAIDRALTPSIDWLRYRFFFYSITASLTIGGVALIAIQGSDMFGSEFRGGTKITIQLAQKPDGSRTVMTRAEIDKIIDDAAAASPQNETLRTLQSADIVVINPEPGDQTRSSHFTIKTTDTRATQVQQELVAALRGVIDAQPALSFAGADKPALSAPIFPIVEPVLGKVIGNAAITDSVAGYLGGAAIVLDDISPPVPVATINQRLAQLRRQQDFQIASAREQQVVLLRGSPDAAQAVVVLVKDPAISFFDSKDRWTRDLQQVEWELVGASLRQSTSLSNVESFSPQIARTFKAQATIALLLASVLISIYVWVRFGSLRYSLAAILTTLHDCVIAVAAIAFAQKFCELAPDLAASIGLQPFRLDLTLVAAVLTIMGYSINDTVVVMDRIRENKGKLEHATRAIINKSVNDTISRTIITGGTTFFAVIVLYTIGGEAVRAFAYAMIIGLIIGTYSSIAVAAPLVWSEKRERAATGHAQ